MEAIVFSGKNQYGVVSHFVKGIIADLALLGIQATECVYNDENIYTLQNNPNYLNKFNFCLSINGIGLDLDVNGKGNFSAATGLPTLVFLVDHPVHLLNRFMGQKVILLCVDQEHLAFANLLGLQAVYFPHAVSKALVQDDFLPILNKNEELIFPASYIDSEYWYKELGEVWDKIGNFVEHANSITRFMQIIGLFSKQGQKPALELTQPILAMCRVVDFYLRAQSRLQTLSLFQQADIKLTVIGNRSEAYKKDFPLHDYQPALEFPQLQSRIRKAKAVIHNSPGFERGLHERILVPMSLGTAVFSHNTPFANQVFQRPGGILDQVEHFQDLPQNYQTMRMANYEEIKEKHTWYQQFKQLLKF